MKTYWCVTSSFDDKGNVLAAITDKIEAETKPENTFECGKYTDIYNDWFESRQEAEAYVETAQMA